jgi:hypothetical protein
MTEEIRKEEITEIPLSEVKALKNQLHDLDLQWIQLLSQRFNKYFEDSDSTERVDKKKLYNIVNGIVTHIRWKVLFINLGNELKADLIADHDRAMQNINQNNL